MDGFGPCPRCRLPLTRAQAGTHEVHGCVRCGGVWLDPQTAQHVAHALDSELKSMTEIAARLASAPVDEAQPVHCPDCRAPLYRYVATRARIELDACKSHGIWFDRGELGKLATQMAVERAYAPGKSAPMGGHLATAAAVGAAGVGTVAVAHGFGQRAAADESRVEAVGEVVTDVVEVAAETAFDGADLLGGAVEVAGVVVDVGGTVLEGALSVLGSILEGVG